VRRLTTRTVLEQRLCRVSPIDLATGAVVKTASPDESTTRDPGTTDPWEALTPEQKVDALNHPVRRAVEQAVPRLIAPARSRRLRRVVGANAGRARRSHRNRNVRRPADTR
jgi:hypothetical protein